MKRLATFAAVAAVTIFVAVPVAILCCLIGAVGYLVNTWKGRT